MREIYYNFHGGIFHTTASAVRKGGDAYPHKNVVRFLLGLIDENGVVVPHRKALTDGVTEISYPGEPGQPSWIPCNGAMYKTKQNIFVLYVNETGGDCGYVNYPFFIKSSGGTDYKVITIQPSYAPASLQAGYHFRVYGRFMRLAEVKATLGDHLYTRLLMCARLPPRRILKTMISLQDNVQYAKKVSRRLRLNR